MDYEGFLFGLALWFGAACAHYFTDLINFATTADAVSTVGELSWLDNPDIWAFSSGAIVVVVHELSELLIFCSILYMESQWNSCKDISIS